MWIQIVSPNVYITIYGTTTEHQPGDVVDVGKTVALPLIEQGRAIVPAWLKAQPMAGQDVGVLMRGKTRTTDALLMGLKHLGVDGKLAGKNVLRLPWGRTLLLDAGYSLSAGGCALGLARVAADEELGWEMAAMLTGQTAEHTGSHADRVKTLEVVGDLRVPVYETRAVWVRRTDATKALVAEWRAALEEGEQEQHAFLRALYARRVVMCTLPRDWSGRWAGE